MRKILYLGGGSLVVVMVFSTVMHFVRDKPLDDVISTKITSIIPAKFANFIGVTPPQKLTSQSHEQPELSLTVDQAQRELAQLEQQLTREDVYAKLNKNQVTVDERKKYVTLFKHMDDLNNYILRIKTEEIAKQIELLEKQQPSRLAQYNTN